MKNLKTIPAFLFLLLFSTSGLLSQPNSLIYTGKLKVIFKTVDRKEKTIENGTLILYGDSFEYTGDYAKYSGSIHIEKYGKLDYLVFRLETVKIPGREYHIGDGSRYVEECYFFKGAYAYWEKGPNIIIGQEYINMQFAGETVKRFVFSFKGKL